MGIDITIGYVESGGRMGRTRQVSNVPWVGCTGGSSTWPIRYVGTLPGETNPRSEASLVQEGVKQAYHRRGAR